MLLSGQYGEMSQLLADDWWARHRTADRVTNVISPFILSFSILFVAAIVLNALYTDGLLNPEEFVSGLLAIVIGELAVFWLVKGRDKETRDALLALTKSSEAIVKSLETLNETNRALLAELKKSHRSYPAHQSDEDEVIT
jgi:hypothetical protein